MYQRLIQEVEDNFASEGLCSFMVDGRCCSSSAPVVHTSGMEAVGTVGIGPLGLVDSELAALGTDMVGSDTALAGSDTGLGTQAGIGGFFAPSASAELKPVPCHQ